MKDHIYFKNINIKTLTLPSYSDVQLPNIILFDFLFGDSINQMLPVGGVSSCSPSVWQADNLLPSLCPFSAKLKLSSSDAIHHWTFRVSFIVNWIIFLFMHPIQIICFGSWKGCKHWLYCWLDRSHDSSARQDAVTILILWLTPLESVN